MKPGPLIVGALAASALGVRVARSRHRRSLHPAGRSFTGDLEVWGLDLPIGSALVDRRARHPVTIRISKGVGTEGTRPDVLGVAVRVHGPVAGQKRDLLFSTAGHGRLLRHVPVLRRGFDTRYGAILPYRTATGRKVYLSAEPDPDGRPLGRTLDAVVAAAEHDGARLLLAVAEGADAPRPYGRVTFGAVLPAEGDAALAFDPVRYAPPDLHPTGLVHGSRALAYRLSQRWRGARPADPDPAAVARTAAHR
jgi:hypothetical protein